MQTKHAATNAEHLTIGAAAALIGVSNETLRRWAKDGRIQCFRTPTNHRRFLRSDIEELLKASA